MGEVLGEAFAGAKVERNIGPTPVFDKEPQGGVRLGVGMRVDAGFVAVGGDLAPVDHARAILSAHAILEDLLGFHRPDGFEDFDLFVAHGIAGDVAGRFHGDEREHTEHVVLHHVAEHAVVVEVAAAVLHPEPLRHGDLHAVDVAAVPVGFENHVGEAENHDVLHRLLTEVMVDAVDLPFLQVAVQFAVQFACAIKVAAERFLDDDAPEAVGSLVKKARLAEVRGHVAEKRGSDGEVENDVASGNAPLLADGFEFFFECSVDRLVVQVAAEVVASGHEWIPLLRVDRMRGELLDVRGHLVAEGLVIARRDGHAHDGELFRQQSDAAEVEEGGDELALGQVAGGTEDDEDAGRCGLPLMKGRGFVVRHAAKVWPRVRARSMPKPLPRRLARQGGRR